MRYVDLTQTFTSTTPVYPGDPVPTFIQREFLESEGVSDWTLSTGMHVGTHIDGPLHMIPESKRLDEFEIENFIGPAALVDARGQKEITAAFITKTNFNKVKIVLFFTDWSKNYGADSYYHDYPVLTTDAAEYLATLGVKMIGLDGPSPDQPPFSVHKILLGNGIFIVENLTNLAALVNEKSFDIIALPIKVTADSALARVVAMVPEKL